jgi:cation:H+ antiporter
MAMPALIGSVDLTPEVFNRDYVAMTGITLLLAVILYGHFMWGKINQKKAVNPGQLAAIPHQSLGRIAGVALLISYIAYYYWLFPMNG